LDRCTGHGGIKDEDIGTKVDCSEEARPLDSIVDSRIARAFCPINTIIGRIGIVTAIVYRACTHDCPAMIQWENLTRGSMRGNTYYCRHYNTKNEKKDNDKAHSLVPVFLPGRHRKTSLYDATICVYRPGGHFLMKRLSTTSLLCQEYLKEEVFSRDKADNLQ
jgi:hypothetical protein